MKSESRQNDQNGDIKMCNLYNKNILSLTLPQVTSVFFVYILNSCSLFTADSWPGGTLLKVYLQQILPSKAYTAAKSPQIQLCALLTTNYSDGAHTILQHNISLRKEQNLFDRKETQLAKNQKNENSVSFFPSTSSFLIQLLVIVYNHSRYEGFLPKYTDSYTPKQ